MANKNMSLEKTPMPEQAPDVRNKNFEEVALGYTAEMAVNEAQALPELQKYALCQRLPGQRTDPPVHLPWWLRASLKKAYQKIAETNHTARHLRPCLPPGEPVRGQMRAGHQGRERGHRPPGALLRRLRTWSTAPKSPRKPAFQRP